MSKKGRQARKAANKKTSGRKKQKLSAEYNKPGPKRK